LVWKPTLSKLTDCPKKCLGNTAVDTSYNLGLNCNIIVILIHCIQKQILQKESTLLILSFMVTVYSKYKVSGYVTFSSLSLCRSLTCKPTCDAKLCSLTVETNTPPLSKQEIWIPKGSTDLSICTRRNSPGDGL